MRSSRGVLRNNRLKRPALTNLLDCPVCSNLLDLPSLLPTHTSYIHSLALPCQSTKLTHADCIVKPTMIFFTFRQTSNNSKIFCDFMRIGARFPTAMAGALFSAPPPPQANYRFAFTSSWRFLRRKDIVLVLVGRRRTSCLSLLKIRLTYIGGKSYEESGGRNL